MAIIGNSALEIIFATLIQKDQGTQLSLDVNVLICETGSFLQPVFVTGISVSEIPLGATAKNQYSAGC